MRIIYFTLCLSLFTSCTEEANSKDDNNSAKVESGKTTKEPENNIQADPVNESTETIDSQTENIQTKSSADIESNKVNYDVKKSESRNKEIEIKKPDLQPTAVEMAKPDFSTAFNSLLKSYVSSSGKVNYSGVKSNKELLTQATQYFEENPPQSSWSKNQKLAYWINAYNLYTIELIVDNYPVKSIKNIAGGKPWDKKFIKLAGRNLSLNDIENGIIRKDFNEPRIHFAVNCASISCPKLLNKAYTASNLNSLLESQTKRFINDNSMNSITATNPQISNIFDWYKVDFGNVISFLNKYSNTQIESSAKISYKDYNWNLNK